VRAIRALLTALCFLFLAISAYADSREKLQPPLIGADQANYLQIVYASHFAPRASIFSVAAAKLQGTVAAMCEVANPASLKEARRAWREAMLKWESAGAVAVGPLLERYTAANIDFWPTRPNMIEAAIGRAPPDTKSLRRVSVAARGLPALEWLLWDPAQTARVMKDAKVCNYARLLADDIAEEAQGLDTRFAMLVRTFPAEASSVMFAELVNQAVGAVEVLRRKRLFNPASLDNPKLFARSLSDQAQPAWNAQWQSIRDLLVGEQRGQAWTFDSLLRYHGFESAATRLLAGSDHVTAALRMASPARPQTALQAAAALLSLRRILEGDVAVPLGIPVSFSEFDGD
jgi:predicted lipoprotein